MQYVSITNCYIDNRRKENDGLGRIGVSVRVSRVVLSSLVCSLRPPKVGGRPLSSPRHGFDLDYQSVEQFSQVGLILQMPQQVQGPVTLLGG